MATVKGLRHVTCKRLLLWGAVFLLRSNLLTTLMTTEKDVARSASLSPQTLGGPGERGLVSVPRFSPGPHRFTQTTARDASHGGLLAVYVV